MLKSSNLKKMTQYSSNPNLSSAINPKFEKLDPMPPGIAMAYSALFEDALDQLAILDNIPPDTSKQLVILNDRLMFIVHFTHDRQEKQAKRW
jgi:hypothetical protein